MQEMYQHLSSAPLQAEKEDGVDYLDTLRQQYVPTAAPAEQIRVGDRVRFKGDHGRPIWMTVIRHDMSKPDDAGNPSRLFVMVAIPTLTDGGGPGLQIQGGIMPEALTTEPPPAAKRPSWGRTVKTPAAATKPVRRAKKR